MFSNRRLHKLENGQARNKPQGLNYIVFDRNFNPLIGESGFIRITTASREDGTNVPHDLLKPDQPLVIKQAGCVYIYLSNENETPVEVFFDDFKVEHIKSPVVQMDDYYPFGLTFNSYQRENSIEQKYLYNGKELQDELDIGWIDYGARMYDPAIARWHVLDPLSERGRKWSPYAFSFDNAMNFIDPDGMWGMSMKERGEQFLADAIAGDGDKTKEEKEKEEKKKAEYEETAKTGPDDNSGNKPTEGEDPAQRTGGGCPPGVDCDWVNGVAANGLNWYGTGGQINWLIAASAATGENLSGTSRIGSNFRLYWPKISGRVFQGNQYVNTFSISRGFHILGRVSFFAALTMDGLGVINYYQDPNGPNSVHPGKFGLNTAMGAFGLTGVGTVPSLLYFGIDSFYPGGLQGYSNQVLGPYQSNLHQSGTGAKIYNSTFH